MRTCSPSSTRAARCSSAARSPTRWPNGSAQGGALIFPAVPDVPFDPWRAALYTPAELYDGLEHGYRATPDAKIYAWSRKTSPRRSLRRLLAKSLHDSSIDDALEEFTHRRRIVGVMGGHRLARDDPAYAEIARLGHDLAAHGTYVATGGGPGAMEAANLGARLADDDPRRARRRASTRSPRCPRSSRTARPGHRSRSTRSRSWPTPGAPSASPRGSTVTSRPTRSARRSRSTSATPSARTCCWRCVERGSCSCPAPPARCRRSSRRPAPTSTHRSPRWCRWSSSARTTGPGRCRRGRWCSPSARAGRSGRSAHLVDGPERGARPAGRLSYCSPLPVVWSDARCSAHGSRRR